LTVGRAFAGRTSTLADPPAAVSVVPKAYRSPRFNNVAASNGSAYWS
jgi:hypothetical protein